MEPPPLSQEAPLYTTVNTDSVEQPLKTMTFFAAVYGPNGRQRTVAVTLPFVSCLVDMPRYQPPPRITPREHGPNMTEHNVRRALGRDPKQAARALNRVGFEHVMRRIAREGL